MTEPTTFYCSFCAKSQHEVRKLIAGPTVFICDGCVDLCNDIIRFEQTGICPHRDMLASDIGITVKWVAA